MKTQIMYYPDPNGSFVELLVCYTCILVSTILGPSQSVFIEYARIIATFVAMIAGLLSIMKALGIDPDLRKRFNNKNSKRNF